MDPMIAINVSFHTNTQMDLLAPWYKHRFRTLGVYNRKALLADFNFGSVSDRSNYIKHCYSIKKNNYN